MKRHFLQGVLTITAVSVFLLGAVPSMHTASAQTSFTGKVLAQCPVLKHCSNLPLMKGQCCFQ